MKSKLIYYLLLPVIIVSINSCRITSENSVTDPNTEFMALQLGNEWIYQSYSYYNDVEESSVDTVRVIGREIDYSAPSTSSPTLAKDSVVVWKLEMSNPYSQLYYSRGFQRIFEHNDSLFSKMEQGRGGGWSFLPHIINPKKEQVDTLFVTGRYGGDTARCRKIYFLENEYSMGSFLSSVIRVEQGFCGTSDATSVLVWDFAIGLGIVRFANYSDGNNEKSLQFESNLVEYTID